MSGKNKFDQLSNDNKKKLLSNKIFDQIAEQQANLKFYYDFKYVSQNSDTNTLIVNLKKNIDQNIEECDYKNALILLKQTNKILKDYIEKNHTFYKTPKSNVYHITNDCVKLNSSSTLICINITSDTTKYCSYCCYNF